MKNEIGCSRCTLAKKKKRECNERVVERVPWVLSEKREIYRKYRKNLAGTERESAG